MAIMEKVERQWLTRLENWKAYVNHEFSSRFITGIWLGFVLGVLLAILVLLIQLKPHPEYYNPIFNLFVVWLIVVIISCIGIAFSLSKYKKEKDKFFSECSELIKFKLDHFMRINETVVEGEKEIERPNGKNE
jgi:glucan phosphoethanolaminetransferase (alkaline phosphatase superfamily)